MKVKRWRETLRIEMKHLDKIQEPGTHQFVEHPLPVEEILSSLLMPVAVGSLQEVANAPLIHSNSPNYF